MKIENTNNKVQTSVSPLYSDFNPNKLNEMDSKFMQKKSKTKARINTSVLDSIQHESK